MESATTAMQTEDSLKTMSLEIEKGVAWITINHPPINLVTFEMVGELDAVSRAVADDDSVRAVVLQSANPDFFLAHFDIAGLEVAKGVTEKPDEPTAFNALIERFRTMPKATIAKLRGRARGAGARFSSASTCALPPTTRSSASPRSCSASLLAVAPSLACAG
jgi:enoyl-CoA hydratase/carnithine racemase